MVKHVFDLPSPCQLRHLALFWVSYFFPFKAWGGCPFLKVSYRVTMNMCPCRFPESACFVGHFRHWFTFQVFFLLPIQHIAHYYSILSYISFDPRFSFFAKYYFLFPFPSHFFWIKIELIVFSRFFFPPPFFSHTSPPLKPRPFPYYICYRSPFTGHFLGGEIGAPPCLNCIICHRQP